MDQDLVSRAKEIISKIIYITIATCSKDGQPWNSPVYSAFDQQYNFYWVSSRESKHSRNIEENGRAFLVIYDSTVNEGTGAGVYVQAKAGIVVDEQKISSAIKLLYERKNKSLKPVSDFVADSPRRIYKATPQKFWMNTGDRINGHYVDGRIEIKLT